MKVDVGSEMIEVMPGMFCEADALRVVEAIKEYDPNLEVLCLDPARAEGITEEPFIVTELCKDGVHRPVLRAWALNELVLERIKLADSQRGNLLTAVDKIADNNKKESLTRYSDIREEMKDIMGSVVGTRQSRYTVRDSRTGDLITFYDDRPATRH